MKTLQFLMAALAATLLLSGCKESPSSSAEGAKAAAEAPVSLSAIEAEAGGFTLGSSISARTVYVFFDPQCPHCAALWVAAKPLRTQAKFVWIPVALMKPTKTSETQGAALLAAKNPVEAMDAHEASMTAGKGGITPAGDIEAQRAVVQKNTALMNRFGFASIPTIVGQNAQTGALVTRQGALPTPELAKLLGLEAP
jgi:thiol:disulfide interchange protein DsbG